MPQSVLIDEFHVLLHIPKRLRENEVRLIRRTLKRPLFLTRVQKVIKELIARYPSLGRVRITASR